MVSNWFLKKFIGMDEELFDELLENARTSGLKGHYQDMLDVKKILFGNTVLPQFEYLKETN